MFAGSTSWTGPTSDTDTDDRLGLCSTCSGLLLPIGQPALLYDPTEPWRLRRLDRVVGFLEYAGIRWAAVESIEDHKGELIVTWRLPPTAKEQAVCHAAWESGVGDGCENVTHRAPATVQ